MKDHLLRLMRHTHRANDETLDALRGTRAPYGAIQLFAHVLTTEQHYLDRVRGEAVAPPATRWPDLSLAQCSMLLADNAAGYEAYLADCTEDDLLRPVRYVADDGASVEMTPADLIFHLVLHGAHHRGQIARIVRDAGGQRLATDYADFVRSLTRSPVQAMGRSLEYRRSAGRGEPVNR